MVSEDHSSKPSASDQHDVVLCQLPRSVRWSGRRKEKVRFSRFSIVIRLTCRPARCLKTTSQQTYMFVTSKIDFLLDFSYIFTMFYDKDHQFWLQIVTMQCFSSRHHCAILLPVRLKKVQASERTAEFQETQ